MLTGWCLVRRGEGRTCGIWRSSRMAILSAQRTQPQFLVIGLSSPNVALTRLCWRQQDRQDLSGAALARGGQPKTLAGAPSSHSLHLEHRHIHHGPHQADRPQVHRWQGAAQAAGHQGRTQVGSRHRRRQEAPPLPPRHGGAARDPQVPEEHGAAHPQAALPAPGP
eukprot:358882-Chlamydomonas_euryale.AAC.5